jgi:hypothetical protein
MAADWASFGETVTADGWHRAYRVDRDDAEDVLRQTFLRVARNVDQLVGRLRDLGYRFECETGRRGPATAPRRPVDLSSLVERLEVEFGDLDPFGPGLSPMPLALQRFAEIVGSVDLRQRFRCYDEPADTALPGPLVFDPEDAEEDARQRRIRQEDCLPHSQTGDNVLERLGDWDPLVVDLEGLSVLADPEYPMDVLPDGGVALRAEIAPSFEHKADVSGGDGLF